MIRKPPGDWQRESAAISAVRSAAEGTRTVAKAGVHSVRGLVCGGFALLWGFAALAGGLLGGSLPTFFGVGLMALGMGWASKRAFAQARAAAGIADDAPHVHAPQAGSSGTTRTICAAPNQTVPMPAYPERETPFDPDAVMARYIAEKMSVERAHAPAPIEAAAAAASPATRQFGRKRL